MSVPCIAGKTDPGCVRERNEDAIALDAELGLIVVADGMGGHNSGEVASGLAVDTIRDHAREAVAGSGDPKLSPRRRKILALIEKANAAIFEKSRALAKDQGMGTTVVVALVAGRSVAVGHVGDSRLYLLRQGQLKLMTEDHSLVMDQVRHGLLTLEQAEKSPLQNILTRALGTEERVLPDIQEFDLQPGDVLMICSDGLTKMVGEAEMRRVLTERQEAGDAVDELISLARAAGGIDNVTVAVARVPNGGGFMARLIRSLFGG